MSSTENEKPDWGVGPFRLQDGSSKLLTILSESLVFRNREKQELSDV